MPTPRTWLPRIDEIIDVLKTSDARELDRPGIEKLFGLQRRSALNLMKQVGASTRGVHFVVLRKTLLAWVEEIHKVEGQEIERRRYAAEQLDEEMAEARAVQKAMRENGRPIAHFPLVKEILEARLEDLPENIQITPGQINILFDPENAEQALQLLYILGLSLTNDLERFMVIQHEGQHGNKHGKKHGNKLSS
jgi:hypothetical protein